MHDRAQDWRLAHHVLVQRAMRFDVADAGALAAADGVEGTDLIKQQVFDFLGRAVHRAATEADQVLIGRVGTDTHVMRDGQGHGLAHDAGVRGVETAGDVGAVDIGHDLGIHTHLPGTEAFADIAV